MKNEKKIQEMKSLIATIKQTKERLIAAMDWNIDHYNSFLKSKEAELNCLYWDHKKTAA